MSGDPRDAAHLADSGLASIRNTGTSPVVASLLLSHKAIAHAHAGDAAAADHAIDAATDALHNADPADVPADLYWFGPASLACRHGMVDLATNRFESGAAHFRHGIDTYDPSIIASRTEMLLVFANALAEQGHVDRACEVANEAATGLRRLTAHVPPRLHADLIKVRRTLTPFANTHAVTTLDATHPDLLTHTPT
jgi:hypothetical protein